MDFNGARVYFECHGAGKSILYLHGWNGSMEGFKENLLGRLEKERRILLLDLPGCGQSDPYFAGFEDLNRIVRILLDETGVSSVMLAGFCLGGAVALDIALRNPEIVTGVCLIETTLSVPVLLAPLRIDWLGRWLLELGLRNRLGSRIALSFLLQPGFPYRTSFLRGFAASDLETSLHYIEMARDYSRQDHERRIRDGLRCPLTIVNGDRPSFSVRATTRRLLNAVPQGRSFVLPRAHHFLVEERPDLLARILSQDHETSGQGFPGTGCDGPSKRRELLLIPSRRRRGCGICWKVRSSFPQSP